MKAIRFMDPGVIEYSEIPQPEIRDDEVLAQIAYAGFCATDIELLTGEMIHIKNGNTKYPIIPGHEWSGTVVAVGKNVRDFKVGDRVTSDVSLGCGECENCRQGHYNLCPNREVVGSYRNRQGVFAQYVAIPQRHLYHVMREIADEQQQNTVSQQEGAVEQLKAEGVTVIEIDKEACQEACMTTWDKYAAEVENGQDIIDAILAVE